MASALVLNTNSLPVAPVTLSYHQSSITPALPERLTGFPVGSVVTVTPLGGQPTSYVIGRTTDYVPYTSAAELSFNGLSFSISGKAIDGDTFTVGPNPSGVSDNRNAGLLGALQTLNTMSDTSATFQASYSQIVSKIGNKAREVEVTLTAQQNLVKQGETAIQSQSGVNLDEEAANLLRYQQAYQAAAKIINISGKLFDDLLSLGR
jgi:flagellar hook-associated protein 1 FlgK